VERFFYPDETDLKPKQDCPVDGVAAACIFKSACSQ